MKGARIHILDDLRDQRTRDLQRGWSRISAFSILNSLLGDQPSRKDTLPAVLDLCWGAHLLTKDNAVVASGTWTAEDLSDRDATE